jgi:preprotein translocase subunit SecF
MKALARINENKTVMKKYLVVCLITGLLIGCAGEKTSSTSTSSNEKIDFAKGLAVKDGKSKPSEIEVYRQRLDQLKKLCIESEDNLAGMVYANAKQGKEAGFEWSTNIDTLNSYIQMAESGFERKPGRCLDIYSRLKESNEDSSK